MQWSIPPRWRTMPFPVSRLKWFVVGSGEDLFVGSAPAE
jgi:hypothetical protein